MPLVYKIDVLQALKERGFNTNRMRKEKLLAESSIQKLREKKPINWQNISQLCGLLGCNVGDLLDYVPDVGEQEQAP